MTSPARYRVVYLDHVARPSGGEIALVRMLAALGERVEAHVILGEDGPLVGQLEAVGATVEVMPLADEAREVRKDTVRPTGVNPRALAAASSYTVALARRLRTLHPHLVHTNSLKAALYGGVAGRLVMVPVLWHVRDRIAPDYLPTPAVHLVRAASRMLPTAVIANSQATLSTLPQLRRGAVVVNSVVYDAVGHPKPSQRGDAAGFRVGIIGRLAPWKGQHVFLGAFAEAFRGEPVEAWVIGSAMFGEDDYAASLAEQAQRLGIDGQVTFRGFREDVWAELAELDVLVHASVTPEPFGQVVVEGMAAGVPVIASRAGGPAEVVTDGKDGLLTPPGDVPALSAAMRRLRDDPALRRRLVAAGSVSAQRYAPEATARYVLEMYDAVARRRPS